MADKCEHKWQRVVRDVAAGYKATEICILCGAEQPAKASENPR